MLLRALVLIHFLIISLPLRANECVDIFRSDTSGYLHDTLSGIELMHGPNHLIYDTVAIESSPSLLPHVVAVNPHTSPTNIAVDLLVQAELASQQQDAKAYAQLSDVLDTLSRIEKHSSGLFFSWYSTENLVDVADRDLSSIDNMHLATALWTVKETFSGSAIGEKARLLFSKMNFSMFYDGSSGLVGGNFTYNDGQWSRDAYNFSNIGSEARILYTLGWSLGLFKDFSKSSDFVSRACKALECEIFKSDTGPILKLWTGSAFQLFFPKIFAGEDVVSPTIKKMYEAAGNFMIEEGIRRGLPTPASHSPGAIALSLDKTEVTYNPNAGNKALVSSDNRDLLDPANAAVWESTFTPYALVMAATSEPNTEKLIGAISKVQSDTPAIYMNGVGWADGYRVTGAQAGQVIPVQIAVNQGMIALSLLQINSTDGMTASSRAIFKNKIVAERMRQAYAIVDQKLEAQP